LRSPGGFDSVPFSLLSPEAQMLSIRLDSQQTALEAVTSRIMELDRLLVGPRVFDPEVSRVRRAARRLQEALARVGDRESRLTGAQAPSVTILGAMD